MTRGQTVAGGDRLGKTIVFAKNQDHAEFIAERFNANYPHYKGEFARVITFKTEYAQSLIDNFSNKDEGAAHRHLGGHARHGHRRARGGEPGVLQAGAVEDQVLADGRTRHAAVPGPVRARASTRSSSTSSTTARTWSSSARTRRRPTARWRVARQAAVQRAAGADRRAGPARHGRRRPSRVRETGGRLRRSDDRTSRCGSAVARAAAPRSGGDEPRQLRRPPEAAARREVRQAGGVDDADDGSASASWRTRSPGCRPSSTPRTRRRSGSTC